MTGDPYPRIIFTGAIPAGLFLYRGGSRQGTWQGCVRGVVTFANIPINHMGVFKTTEIQRVENAF